MKKIFVLLMACLAFAAFITMEAKENKEMKNKPVAIIKTTQGNIEVTLMPEVAPKAVENFVSHANSGYYNGTIFHRVIKNFMIQGGDPKGNGTGGESIWGKEFEDEVSADVSFDKPGLLAMANRGPATNGSQFFITTAKTPWLNMRHTIFGQVTNGYDIVEKIENVETNGMDKPSEDQKILSITIKK